jgi:6-phosphofructokinase 2
VTLNPTVDQISAVDQVVAERKLRCDDPTFDPGGGGINVARVVVELGGRARASWTRGGPGGARLQALLDAKGLDHVAVPIEGDTRQHLIVSERSSGRQFRFGFPGPRLSEAEIEACLETVRSAEPTPGYLVLSGSLPADAPEDLYARFVRAAPRGCRVVLDTNGDALAHGQAAGVYLIKPNVRELGHLAGVRVEEESQIRDVARRLIDEGTVEVVVTSLGAGGVMATTQGDHWHVRAPTVKARSAVGAGDSMVGGIVFALSHDWPLEEAVRYGVAAGSAAVLTPGTELCRRQDVERLFGGMGASVSERAAER